MVSGLPARPLVLLTLGLCGCFSPEYGSDPFSCVTSDRCPEGYRCVEGVCRTGAIPDGERAGDVFWPDMPSDLQRKEGARWDLPAGKESGVSVPGKWVFVKAGQFTMGATGECVAQQENSETAHTVTLTRNFEMQTTEVTQAEFKAVMGYNDSLFAGCGSSCPVEQVTWHEAAAYCNALSKLKGLSSCYNCTGSRSSTNCTVVTAYAGKGIYNCPGYRLPTEAEWEYACRAGTKTAWYSGSSGSCTQANTNAGQIGWYGSNSGGKTHPVGQKAANAWGFFDMAGNVVEWCHDLFQKDLGSSAVSDPVGISGSTVPVRGGHWRDKPAHLRAAARTDDTKSWRESGEDGFRCVRMR